MKYKQMKKEAFSTLEFLGEGDGTWIEPISKRRQRIYSVEERIEDNAVLLEVKSYSDSNYMFTAEFIDGERRTFPYDTTFTVLAPKGQEDEGLVCFNSSDGKEIYLLKDIVDIFIEI
jgi:hypothetical protein